MGLQLIGGLIGNEQAAPAYGQSRSLVNQAVDAYGNLVVPQQLTQPINFGQYSQAGQLNPTLEQTINGAPSQAAQVQANPQLVQAQMQALNNLQQLSQTGMNPTTRAALNQIQNQAAAQAEGQRQQILQSFAQRGQAGSGEQLLSQLNASQNAANQANQAGLQQGAMASQNALQALGMYGNQAGTMNQQQFGQQFETGSAADQLNRFNVQNQLAQQARNVANQNVAQQYNLQNLQQIKNANVGLGNQAQILQRQGYQQQFQDAAQKAAGLSGASMQGANAYAGMGNRTANQWQNIGTGLQGAVNSIFGMAGGGAPGGRGGGGGSFGFANGGEVPGYSFGGKVPKEEDQYVRTYGNGYDAPNNFADGGTAADYSNLNNLNIPLNSQQSQSSSSGSLAQMAPMLMALMSKGGVTPGSYDGGAQTYIQGGKVNGKAQVKGDDPRNDTVKAMLSPGEIVIPRSIAQDKNAPDKSKKFVEKEKKHEQS